MQRARVQWLTTVGGMLAVVAAFALSLPGVQAARAGEPIVDADAHEFSRFLAVTGDSAAAQPAGPAGPASCGAENTNRVSANSAELLGGVMRQMQAQAAREGHQGPVEVIVLNGRGYNYGAPSDPRIEQHLIEREIGR